MKKSAYIIYIFLTIFFVSEILMFSSNLSTVPSTELTGKTRTKRDVFPPAEMLKNPVLPEIPPTPYVSPDDPPEFIEYYEMTHTRSPEVIKEYEESLRKHQAKLLRLEKEWTDNENATCFRTKSLPCTILPELSDLPPGFSGACAPGFIVIGSAKSGSTSLYYYLVSHPQVNQALSGIFNKEVRYFTDHWFEGTSWYLQQFPPITPYDLIFPEDTTPTVHMMNGEASPTYFFDLDAPSRIKAVTPDAKLVVILRNPADRAYSEKMQLLGNKITFIEDPYEDMKYQIDEWNKCIARVTLHRNYTDPTDEYFHCYRSPPLSPYKITHEPYVLHSLYVYQIRNWLRYFPQNQILFVKAEDMYNEPEETMKRVTEHIGLCDIDWTEITSHVHNRKKDRYPDMSPELRKMLTDFFAEYNDMLYDHLGININW